MMLERKPLIFFTVVIAIVALFAVTPAVADGPDPACPNNYPCELDDFDSFLLNQDSGGQCGNYFNPVGGTFAQICEEIPEFDFVGAWNIAAIALEADFFLTVAWGDPALGVSLRSEDCANWGLFKEINFDVANLYFTDGHSGSNVLDPFCPGGPSGGDPNCGAFRVCRLKQDSNLLSYLTNPISLRAGDLIIGWDDSAGDGDHEDIVLVARQESRTSLVPAQIASVTEFIQTDTETDTTCKITINAELLPNPAAVTVEKISGPGPCTFSISLLTELTFNGGQVTTFPFEKWVATSASPGEFTYCYPSGYCVVFTF